jgi:rhodanese-related sulfurtransferase
VTSPRKRLTIDEMLDLAAARISRYEPEAADVAGRAGAQLIDVRTEHDRVRDGVVPGSIHVPRTLLEWRASPEGELRNPHLGDLDRPLIVMCNHGFSSVLAAASLADLGYEQSGDLIGGFEAWKASGLATIPAPARDLDGELEGMAGPDL